MKTRLSVIIPVYNEESVIGECLESLFKQTTKDLEIIVVDDGSNDKTLSVIQNLESDVRIIESAHKGPGAARNLGASKAKGNILVLVDADMTFEPNFVEKLVEPIIAGKSKGTFSTQEFVANTDNLWARMWGLNEERDARLMHRTKKMGVIGAIYHRLGYAIPHLDFSKEGYEKISKENQRGVFRAILKSEFDRVGGFDPGGYTDDWSLSEKLGYDATVAKGARFYHKNPSTLPEVFVQARWAGKREYKLGAVGTVYALLRTSLPVSLIVGLWKSITKVSPAFLLFKIVHDLGMFVGILEFVFTGKGSK